MADGSCSWISFYGLHRNSYFIGFYFFLSRVLPCQYGKLFLINEHENLKEKKGKGRKKRLWTSQCSARRTFQHQGFQHLPSLGFVGVDSASILVCKALPEDGPVQCGCHPWACPAPSPQALGWQALGEAQALECVVQEAQACALRLSVCPPSRAKVAVGTPQSATCSGRAFPVFAMFSAGAFQLV